jgi:hypothetical protein
MVAGVAAGVIAGGVFTVASTELRALEQATVPRNVICGRDDMVEEPVAVAQTAAGVLLSEL